MVSFDLGEYSKRVRKDLLVPSSGWIGDLVIPIADLTGIWDIFLIFILFICSWTTIRLSDRVIALILARGFDATIPLQYHLNPNAQKLHAAHCERYWPIWYIAMALEVAAYFLFHPDLFTLVTCFKTTAMVVMWHGRSAEGKFWLSSSGAAGSGSESDQRKAKQAAWNATLKAKGYSSKARVAMMKKLNSTPSDKRDGMVKTWGEADAAQMTQRNAEYERRADS